MYHQILNKMKSDTHIATAIREKRKQITKKLLLYTAGVCVFALLLCILAKFKTFEWIVTWGIAAVAIILPFCFLPVITKRQTVFLGKISQMEEERKIVPRKGSGAVFGTSHKYALDEVRELHIAITDENGRIQVIFCPPQYEKLFHLDDTLLCHSSLPYPAHLSNVTTGICMHCGTMQSAENETCITCGADIYSFHTFHR